MADEQSSRDSSNEPSDVSADRVRRRRYSLPKKMAILAEVERCTSTEQVIALLAREGLHSSQLTVWRKQFDKSKAHADKQPSRRTSRTAELGRTIGQLELEKAELQRQLQMARQLLELPRSPARPQNAQGLDSPRAEDVAMPAPRWGGSRRG